MKPASPETAIDQIMYQVYRYVIAINHYKDELYIFEHDYGQEKQEDGLEQMEIVIKNRNFPTYDFKVTSSETSNVTDEKMRATIRTCIDHCHRGDVFQIVPSRRFSREFQGDEFNVYRALRSINPSPYLFYFDYGNYKIFGSSPEKADFHQETDKPRFIRLRVPSNARVTTPPTRKPLRHYSTTPRKPPNTLCWSIWPVTI